MLRVASYPRVVIHFDLDDLTLAVFVVIMFWAAGMCLRPGSRHF
jgi:hypothetical protein